MRYDGSVRIDIEGEKWLERERDIYIHIEKDEWSHTKSIVFCSIGIQIKKWNLAS